MTENWKLLVVDGPDRGKSFEIPNDRPLVIGRGADSDTKIHDPRLSRIHCELSFSDDKLILTDCGSSAGTFVGAVPISEPKTLGNGSEFQIGETRLRVDLGDLFDSGTLSGDEPVRPMKDLVGEVFFRYRLDELVSTTNTSAVFRAFDTKHELQVAFKILKPQMTSMEDQKDRFIRAMRTMLPVKHPNIVRLRKAARTGPYCWAALDWIDGTSIDRLIELSSKDGVMPWKEAWQVATHVGRALEEAARQRIVHRNLTPSNILRNDVNQSYVLSDLIFAKALDVTDSGQITRPGDLIGELAYMAPERILDPASVDTRSDIYGLGATLYALLTGRPPFQGGNVSEILEQIRSKEPAPPSNFQPEVESRFADIVVKMLAKSPSNRYATPAEFLAHLQQLDKYAGIEQDDTKVR